MNSLDAPKSSADVRNTANKSEGVLENKLYGQSKSAKKASHKSRKPKRQGNTAAGSNNASKACSSQDTIKDTVGSWAEEGGPKGHMPKLPTSSGGTPSQQPSRSAAIPPAKESWASVAKKPKTGSVAAQKQVARDDADFPALGKAAK